MRQNTVFSTKNILKKISGRLLPVEMGTTPPHTPPPSAPTAPRPLHAEIGYATVATLQPVSLGGTGGPQLSRAHSDYTALMRLLLLLTHGGRGSPGHPL